MTLHAHRSQRIEQLVDALAAVLSSTWADDPFVAAPVVVGSRGMERWLRHELATRLGGLSCVAFLFPRTAFEEAARALLGDAGELAVAFEPASGEADAWGGATLTMRVLSAIRARLDDPRFARVRGYLGALTDEVRAREMAFAGEVSSTIERLLYDRPDDALAWSDDPASAPEEHAWLAELLRALDAEAVEPSPARRLAALRLQATPAKGATGASLFVFGLSTMRPGDKLRLAALAQHLDVHLFALAPSSEWWEDIRARSEQQRALRSATSAADVAAQLAELDRQNAMLAANGGPSRDLQLWLEALGYDEPVEARPLEPAPTLLGALHAWIDAAADNPARGAWQAHAGCPSLEVHACHGPLRQCEALRDELLRRFAADPTLEPRHVLVMTPDVEKYAPLLAAVCARHGADAPSIPLHVADLGLRATNPVADGLLQVLALADERVTASRLLDVIAIGPLRARFELSDDDLADLRAMIVDAGIRWAWDAEDRGRHDQPTLDQNTVRFGLERLALGVLMPDPGGLSVIASTDPGLVHAVPVELATRDRVERFGRLAELCAKLEGVRARVIEAAPCAVWRERLRALLDDFTHCDDDAAWLRVQVDETLTSLLPDEAGDGLRLDRTAIAALLGGAFELPMHGDRPLTGAVTVCALEPMRSVPFRIVAMLGLDDDAFPRPGRLPAWDPFLRPRRGEYDRRTVDRHLFLEATLCARDALLIFGTGFEPKRGAKAPLSVVVSELCDLVATATARAPDELLVRHPLQPWSERAFEDASRLPFDGMWRESAEALRGARVVAGIAATRLDAEWPAEEQPPRSITADALAGALAAPQKELLRGRLGLSLAADESTVEDREPLEHDNLDAWQLRDLVLRAFEDGEPDAAAIEARLRGEGVLALQAAGRRALDRVIEEARSVRARADDVPGARIEERPFSCQLGELLVGAVATDVRSDDDGDRLVWVTPSDQPNERLLLRAWITMLVAVASRAKVAAAHVAAFKGTTELVAPSSVDEARARLEELVATWRTIRTSPAPLFPKLSRAVVDRARKSPEEPPHVLVRNARAAWEGAPNQRGAADDAWVGAIFGHLDVEALAERGEAIVELASVVWRPLLDAIVKKGGKKSGAEAQA